MAEPVEQAVLPPDAAARLIEFARTCKAAARAVSLYPAGHPAIVASLSRIADATARLTEDGPYSIQVHAQELLVAEGRVSKSDPAIADLAALLHRHFIGRLTLNVGADAASWRTLLLLLARSPEEVRADGGIAHLWQTAGGPSIDIHEIDYAEVLRDRQGKAASIESIIAAASDGTLSDHDDGAMSALLDMVKDPARLEQLLKGLQTTAAASPQGAELQTSALLALLRNLVTYVSRTDPQQVTELFERLGRGVRHLSVEAMIALLAERGQPGAAAGSVDAVEGLVGSMSDSSVAGFVAESVIAERGASERLAHAFRALVPEYERQRQLLGLAREEVERSDVAADQESFEDLWKRVEAMMSSYSDARYVSTDYARELSHARTQPMDVERTSDDPPERVAAWLATVSDSSLRNLDRFLLTDLLAIEAEPERWRDVAGTVLGHADDLVRVGFFDQALVLIRTLVEEAARDPRRGPYAEPALERFGRGSLIKHLPAFLRTADDAAAEELKLLCHRIGPTVIAALAEALAAEQDPKSRRRLRDTLVGFGPRGAESVRPLMNSGTWEVRRTAAFLLREFGGTEGLKELVPLLSDAEPLVQREAVHGLALHGSRAASAILLDAILTGKGRTRDTLLKEVLAMRDDRAAPLFAYVLRELEPGRIPELYDTAVEVLGHMRSDDSVDALAAALRKGQWWTPFANRRRRAAAAASLRRIGTPGALDALRDASARGASGVRSAARAVLDKD